MKRRNFLIASGLILNPWSFFGRKKDALTPQDDTQVTLKAGDRFILPAEPKPGQVISFLCGGRWSAKMPLVAHNGHPIMGSREDLVLDIDQPFALVFLGPDRGWILQS